jgi:plasmid stabilization system protein ParE
MAALPVLIAPAAEEDLLHANAWYAERAPLSAESFLNELFDVVDAISRNPMNVPANEEGVHRRPLRRFPYWVYYETQGTRVTLLALAHRRRGPGF